MAESIINIKIETNFKQRLLYPKDFINKIICGDSLRLMKQLPNNCIDAIITDPPYGLNTNGIKNDHNLSLFFEMLPECYRVLKDNSFFITFFSTKFLPELFINNPFTYFWQFILYCPQGSVRSPIGFTKYMSCFVFKKGNPRLTKRKVDIFRDTPGKMVEPDEGYIDHPTPKPKHFIKEIMDMTSEKDDLILDPLIGSGSTAVACKQLMRRFIGFEIQKDYCLLAIKRLEKIKQQ